MKKTLLFFASLFVGFYAQAQNTEYNQIDENGVISRRNTMGNNSSDSLHSNKEIPIDIKAWTVDEKFGDRTVAKVDTMQYMFMNSIFTSGLEGQYNTTGNLGSPRINRIFINRQDHSQFIFTDPYSYFITPVNQFHFTNTLSPFTILNYNTGGGSSNGEDHFKAIFGVNAGRKLGVGFKFDYIYGRGFYNNQSSAHFNYTMYGSYLGEQYQAHLLLSTNHQKNAENGGITNDGYITTPEAYNEDYSSNEIPTVLNKNWNRNNNLHAFLTHRYSVGFTRKVKMTEEEIKAKKFALSSKEQNDTKPTDKRLSAKEREKNKSIALGRPEDAKVVGSEPVDSISKTNKRIQVKDNATRDSLLAISKKNATDSLWFKSEYVPVTSFIHTAKFDTYDRIYQAYYTPSNYYKNQYYNAGRLLNDSIYDQTKHFHLQNTFAISLLEGFNKWAKAGVKAFITSDFRHFELPLIDGSLGTYNEHNLSVGGEISKTLGKTLHYKALLETWVTGKDAGQLKLDVNTDVNFKLFGDTVTLAASGFFHRINPSFYFRHYHSRHFWWDNNSMDKMIHTRLEGLFSYKKTNTALRVAVDNIKNYTYFAQSYSIDNQYNRLNVDVTTNQYQSPISLLTLELIQKIKFGIFRWENTITYQKSSNNDIWGVPDLNIYSNLYMKFKIAKVLSCDLGADVRYFTEYYALDYSPALGSYTVQDGTDKVKIGNYPFVNVYANFLLKHTRFFVMYSHVNAGAGSKRYFLTPHYPTNERIFRFGVSWNFFN